jgi:hypothetical protein
MMTEKERAEKLEKIFSHLKPLPQEAEAFAIIIYSARMEGFAEGFIAGKAYAEK